jgi:hypothetical protein
MNKENVLRKTEDANCQDLSFPQLALNQIQPKMQRDLFYPCGCMWEKSFSLNQKPISHFGHPLIFDLFFIYFFEDPL